MIEKIERQLPVGIGGERLKEGRETLPAIEVANEVSWVNNKMNLPFELKVGEPSRLGMFLTPDPKTGEKIFNLEVSDSHTRSGILGRVIFSDQEGRLYRDIDLKGVGYFRRSGYQNDKLTVKPRMGSYGKISGGKSAFGMFRGTPGIANQELIRRDINYSEKFLKAGIRTHRAVAVVDLKEVVDEEGDKVTIAEAKKRGILSEKDEPIVEIRAYGVRSRLFDVDNALESLKTEDALRLLSDAKNIVAQELNIDLDKFTYDKYFEWLIKTMALNLARMHYNRWVNGYITEHNITLDGRIVDLDSVDTILTAKRASNKGVYGVSKTFDNDRLEVIGSFKNILRQVQENEIYNFQVLSENFSIYFSGLYEEELKRLRMEKVRRVR